jgi:hypothetical protein
MDMEKEINMICNEERHTERLTPKITTPLSPEVVDVVTLRRSLLGKESVKKMDTFLLYKEYHKSR